MPDFPQAANKLSGNTSRLEHDISRVKTMTDRVRSIQERLMRHLISLGYYNPQPAQTAGLTPPVVNSLSDALSDHERALDELSGTLNLFD